MVIVCMPSRCASLMSTFLMVFLPECCASSFARSPSFMPISSRSSLNASLPSSATRSAPAFLSSFSMAAKGIILRVISSFFWYFGVYMGCELLMWELL